MVSVATCLCSGRIDAPSDDRGVLSNNWVVDDLDIITDNRRTVSYVNNDRAERVVKDVRRIPMVNMVNAVATVNG